MKKTSEAWGCMYGILHAAAPDILPIEAVDWAQPDAAIARAKGVTRQSVRKRRAKL